MRNRLICIAGPTATGKSALAVELSKRIGGEVISADSVQVYKGLNIGSAKIKPEEMGGIRHHLIDVLELNEEFNVCRFKEMAAQAVEEINKRSKVPVLTGGTGFYIQALLYDIDFLPGESDSSLRSTLEEQARTLGNEGLHERLKSVDPEYADITPANNVKRVIRALEYYELTGKKFSERNERQAARTSPYELTCFVLNLPRQQLYERIDKRVDEMMEEGFLEEVRHLKEKGASAQTPAMNSLGYKQLLRYLNGELELSQAVYEIKRDTRHFAKRQLTWFKRERDFTWVELSEFKSREEILSFMEDRAGING